MNKYFSAYRKHFLLLITILFALQFNSNHLFAQTKWYVDKDASGLNNGTSWNNAWTSFANIGWSNIQAGDVVFISGGTDSLVYNETLIIATSGVTIKRSTEVGHNGKVIIDGQSTRNGCIVNESSSVNNTIIDGLDKNKFILRKFILQGIRFRYNHNNTVRNFTIELNEPVAFCGVFLYGGEWESPPTFAGPYTIEDFSIIQDSGSYSGGGNSDGIQMGGVDGVTIRNGYIRLWNANPTPHSDGIQLYHSKNILIEDNQIIHRNAGATSNKQGIYMTGSGGDIKIRNNYVLMQSLSFGSAIAIEVYDNTWWTVYAPPDSFIVTNNTVDCLYDNHNAIRLVQALGSTSFSANTILKNNIFVKGTFAIDRKFFTSGSNCDYNNYYDGTSAVSIWDATTTSTGTGRTWATWQSYGFDTHSYTTNPQLTGYIPASTDVIDRGTNLSGLGYSTDILGTTRPVGSAWDIGAFEYTNGSTAIDNTPPILLGAAVINPTTIELSFSEALESIAVLNKLNYTINNGIIINSVSISSDSKKVTLSTTQNAANQTYTVVVNNVKDLAGNIISANNSAQYSFVDNTTGDLKANVKIYLQGPFLSSNMMTELSGNEFLPASQPYNAAPWFYNGTEVLGAGASSSTDWVLVELRSAQNPAQIISKRACLLRNDGRIIEPDGTLGITFKNLLYGSYYIAVFQRNHLAVMTSVPVSFSPDNSLYDFTNAVTKAYGQSGMTEITTGIFGMYAGDADGNGTINESDRSEIWSNQNGTMGYLNGDFNLDSGVTVKDINDYWNFNEGKVTQVP